MCLVSERRLTEALLYLDFNISLILPENRLCPPVSYRSEAVLHISDRVSFRRYRTGACFDLPCIDGRPTHLSKVELCALDPRHCKDVRSR